MVNILGRYTAIIITTLVFLTLVLCVLGLNFYSSYSTEQTAEAVNIAGRQRMLSQRTAKSLIALQSKLRAGVSYEKSLSELINASNLFDRSLEAFTKGSATLSTKSGETTLSAVADPDGRAILTKADLLWRPFYGSLSEMISRLQNHTEASFEPSSEIMVLLDENVVYADANINTLLSLMNDLTNYQENLASREADRSRLIQAIGILASLLCFGIILYLIFGQLRKSDLRTAQARRETRQIFETVDQGLFLIRRDFLIGSQQSKALENIFLKAPESGENFKSFIGPLVNGADLDKVERFLNLLFNPHKKQALLRDLNPLNDLPIQLEKDGELTNKHLRFSFSRVLEGDEIRGVLTSVTDISNEVKLAQELAMETKRNEQQLEMISVLLKAEAESLPDFLANSDEHYQKVNEVLRSPSKSHSDFKHKANTIMALIHTVKGDSSALGLDLVTQACHEFESQIDQIIAKTVVSGNDFLSLTILLDRLISINEQIKSVVQTVQRPGNHSQNESAGNPMANSLFDFVEDISARQHKDVKLFLAGFDGVNLDVELRKHLQSLANQLVGNAICHGVEAPQERLLAGKMSTGQVSLALYRSGTEGFKLICEDDGSGIDFEKLANTAVEKGLLDSRELVDLNPRRLLALMMSNRLSSRSEVDFDAGRGIGLNVVGEITKKINAKVSLQTRPGKGSKFTINIPDVNELTIKKNNTRVLEVSHA